MREGEEGEAEADGGGGWVREVVMVGVGWVCVGDLDCI